jgi:hypothetical protein
MKMTVCLIFFLLFTITGCRFVLDDNPPDESSEEKNETTEENTEEKTEPTSLRALAKVDVAFLNSHDPRLYRHITNDGVEVTISGSRGTEGSVESIQQITFESHNQIRTLRMKKGLAEYDINHKNLAKIIFSDNEETATALVYRSKEKLLQSYLLTLDETRIYPSATGPETKSVGITTSAMATFHESSGFFVVTPMACGLPVKSDTGTNISLKLKQEGVSRNFPIHRDGDGVWRTTVPLHVDTPSSQAEQSSYHLSLQEEIERVCTAKVSTTSESTIQSGRLNTAAMFLSRKSKSIYHLLPEFESDINTFCGLSKNSGEKPIYKTEKPFDYNKPIEAELLMRQGYESTTSTKSWILKPGENLAKMSINAPDSAQILEVEYTKKPMYPGDQFSLVVRSQCSEDYTASVEVTDRSGEEMVSKSSFIHQGVELPYKTTWRNLFVGDEKAPYLLDITLKSPTGQVSDQLSVGSTLR